MRYQDAAGSWCRMPAIIAIGRPYALELIRADKGERYAGLLDYLNGRPLRARAPHCTNLPADLAAYLEAGTGLLPDHETALRILDAGGKPAGWRVLALEAPGAPLRPSWCGKDCGRFYAMRPALQSLPKDYRREALFPAGSGEGFAELDFSCCHANIARILAGLEPALDFYAELARVFAISRERVKEMVLPILHGRTRAEHVHRYGWGSDRFYDGIVGSLSAPGERLHELEADIMRGVLRRMKAAGMPAGLPLHDSILTAEPGAVADFMREESERVLRRPLPFRISPAGPALRMPQV